MDSDPFDVVARAAVGAMLHSLRLIQAASGHAIVGHDGGPAGPSLAMLFDAGMIERCPEHHQPCSEPRCPATSWCFVITGDGQLALAADVLRNGA